LVSAAEPNARPLPDSWIEWDVDGTPVLCGPTHARTTEPVEPAPPRFHHLAWNGTEWIDSRCGCRYHPDDDNGSHGGAPHIHPCEQHATDLSSAQLRKIDGYLTARGIKAPDTSEAVRLLLVHYADGADGDALCHLADLHAALHAAGVRSTSDGIRELVGRAVGASSVLVTLIEEARQYITEAAAFEPNEDADPGTDEDARWGPELLARIHAALGMEPPAPIEMLADD